MDIHEYRISQKHDGEVWVSILRKNTECVYDGLLTWHPTEGYTWHTDDTEVRVLVQKALDKFNGYHTLLNTPGYQEDWN